MWGEDVFNGRRHSKRDHAHVQEEGKLDDLQGRAQACDVRRRMHGPRAGLVFTAGRRHLCPAMIDAVEQVQDANQEAKRSKDDECGREVRFGRAVVEVRGPQCK